MNLDVSQYMLSGWPRYEDDELQRILRIYSQEPISSFLRSVSGCHECEGLPIQGRPINLLCNRPTDVDPDKGISELSIRERRYENLMERLNEEAQGDVEHDTLLTFISEEVFGVGWNGFGGIDAGLSIGLHPWADYSINNWKEGDDRVDLMVVADDWFSINTTLKKKSIFSGRYHASSRTWLNFWSNLREASNSSLTVTEFQEGVMSRFRVLFTNAMLCLRRGVKDTGDENLSYSTFVRCQPHLKRQIAIFRPRVLVGMGHIACTQILEGLSGCWSPRAKELVRRSFKRSGNLLKLDVKRNRSYLSEVYRRDSKFLGLDASLRGQLRCAMRRPVCVSNSVKAKSRPSFSTRADKT